MSGINTGSNQPIKTIKVEAVEKKTMLDKGVDAIKEKTAKGTIIGDHYVAGFNVAVDNISVVGVGERIADLDGNT